MSKIVIALGGNALGKNPQEQHDLIEKTVKHVVDLVEDGNQIVITHGNGPQVGMIYDSMQKEKMPFAESGAMSQGYIGYQLQQTLKDELNNRGIEKSVVTVVTQVEVDPKDNAFKNPTKPIGEFLTKEEATKRAKKDKAVYKEDSGRGYRKVVASPMPKKILELNTIEKLVNDGTIVIACGGGGIPVVMTKKDGYEGIDAVIDKDRTSALLAKEINADELLILTAVDQVSLNFNKKNEEKLSKLSVSDARVAIRNEEFGEGSMLPKIEAACYFASKTGKKAIISSLEKARDAIDGKNGTLIYQDEVQEKSKKKRISFSLSAFTIILILIYLLAAATHLLPTASFDGDKIVNGSGVVGATLSQALLAPIKGFGDAIDICVFVLILGSFLKIVNSTNAIETGIQVLIKKLHGHELILIPILMILFSIGGTTYGMLEETVGFYALLAAAMVAAGMDTIVSSAIVLLGAGSGVLGSTVNPFAVGVAVDAAKSVLPAGTTINQGVIIGLGAILWITTLLISIIFVMSYAKKVIAKKGSTILSLQEVKNMEATYGDEGIGKKNVQLSGRQKLTLILFAFTFVIMIISFIPWEDFGVTLFADSKFIGLSWLVGCPLGQWYFQEATLWFLMMAIIIAIVNKMPEHEIVDKLVDGADDMVGVILIIALARGASVLMSQTYLDNYLIYNASKVLEMVPRIVFAPLNYIFHVGLSVLVPSSSGLATLSSPIMAPLAQKVGFSVETTIMEMVAANGFVNLFTPTCGAIMGGLALAKVEYTSWLKWVSKVLVCIALANILILTIAMLIL
ncbi:MAG: carbamate kinase [Bacilli bacterium]|nr:carbamate kinase [Bacilli bacterium]